jgi:hypothetical protein
MANRRLSEVSDGFIGINANFNMYLDSGYTIAILSNYGDGMGPVDSKAHEPMDAVE